MTTVPPPVTADSGAGVIARFLRARGVERVFGLCGGHIMPIWMRIDAEGIRIVDVRDERAEDLPTALARALENRPALLDVVVTPEAASSDAKSGLAWVPDLQAIAAWDEAEARWRAGGAAPAGGITSGERNEQPSQPR